ncbi:MAG: Outer membrane protein (porin) [Marinobacter excellens HL-55]|uniref:Outer membrane protein (Porin) n=1 Tax=Marinobacter excellens HL-55 TaxID=1305731 RepID=A0A0N8KL37_9GAMM|nr:MAG: Outer membrane protein (porin) [Marinobacter excellens HL-55]
MKKLLLAVAVSTVAAGSVNAATIYEKDGFTYKLNGDFQVQFREKTGFDERLKVEYDDLELKNYVAYDLGNDLTAFGRLDYGYNKDGENGLEEAYLGLKYQNVSFSFGNQNFAGDEFGIEEAYEVETIDEDRFDGIATSGNDSIRVDVELENVYIAASHEMDAADDEGEFYDLFVATKLADLELAAAYQQSRAADAAESADTWGVSASYDFGFMNLAADYSMTDEDDFETTQYNIAAVFAVASTTDVAVGMGNKEVDDADDITEWYANVTYKFPAAKNVSAFAEIADSDLEENGEDADLGFLAGMRVKF